MWKCRLMLSEPFVEHLLPEESWHCLRENKNTGSVPVAGPPVTGPSPTGSGPGSAQKNQGFGGGVIELSLWFQSCERWRRWHKTNPGLVIFGRSSGKAKSAPSAGSDGRLTSHFGHIKRFKIRDKWSGAKSSRCLCRLVWQAWLLHCFICLWYSHRSGRARLNSHTTCTVSPEKCGLFLWFVSKITQLSLKAPEHFGVGVLSSFWSHMLRLSCFHQQTKASVGTIEVACSTISIVWVQEMFKCLIEGFSWPLFSLKDDVPAWFLHCAQFLDPFQISKGQSLAKNSYKSIH